MTKNERQDNEAVYYPWTGEKPPVKGRIFHCPACDEQIQVEFIFGGPDTVYEDCRSSFPIDGGRIARYGEQQAAEEYLTDEAFCDSCFRTVEMKSGSSARRQAALLILEAEQAINQNDNAYQKPLKELHDALLPAFLKTFDFSILRDLHPDSFSKSIGDPRFLNPNSRNSMIQKYLTAGGCGLMAGLFVDALCSEGACILSDHAKSSAPHIAAIAKNLPYVSGFEYAPWNICRAISLNDYGGLIETRPRTPAPNTPDIDVWMRGALNLAYFNTLITERMEPENRSTSEEDISRDSAAFRFIAKEILDYARFERALRKVMMSLAPEAYFLSPMDDSQ